MTGQFLSMAQLKKFVRNADSFDDFLQNVANFSIERFIGHTYFAPADRPNDTLSDAIEKLLNAMIESGFEVRFNQMKGVVQ